MTDLYLLFFKLNINIISLMLKLIRLSQNFDIKKKKNKKNHTKLFIMRYWT